MTAASHSICTVGMGDGHYRATIFKVDLCLEAHPALCGVELMELAAGTTVS